MPAPPGTRQYFPVFRTAEISVCFYKRMHSRAGSTSDLSPPVSSSVHVCVDSYTGVDSRAYSAQSPFFFSPPRLLPASHARSAAAFITCIILFSIRLCAPRISACRILVCRCIHVDTCVLTYTYVYLSGQRVSTRGTRVISTSYSSAPITLCDARLCNGVFCLEKVCQLKTDARLRVCFSLFADVLDWIDQSGGRKLLLECSAPVPCQLPAPSGLLSAVV